MLYNPKWKKPAKTLAQIYTEAADAIDLHGHSLGNLRASDGSMCVWGAINFVATGSPFSANSKTMEMLEPLSQFTGGKGVVGWNNAPERTKEEAVELLRIAARAQSAA